MKFSEHEKYQCYKFRKEKNGPTCYICIQKHNKSKRKLEYIFVIFRNFAYGKITYKNNEVCIPAKKINAKIFLSKFRKAYCMFTNISGKEYIKKFGIEFKRKIKV